MRGEGLLTAARWCAYAACVVVLFAVMLAAAAITATNRLPSTPRLGRWGGPSSIPLWSGVFIAGVIIVALFVAARNLRWFRGRGAVVFFVVAGVLAAGAAVFLADPSLVIGTTGTAHLKPGEMDDATVAGLGMVLGMGLAVGAGCLTLAASVRHGARDRSRTGS